MSQKQILTIVVSLVCAGIAFAEIQNIRYAKQIDTPTTIHPIRLIACIAIVLMGIYSLVTGNYILNVGQFSAVFSERDIARSQGCTR